MQKSIQTKPIKPIKTKVLILETGNLTPLDNCQTVGVDHDNNDTIIITQCSWMQWIHETSVTVFTGFSCIFTLNWNLNKTKEFVFKKRYRSTPLTDSSSFTIIRKHQNTHLCLPQTVSHLSPVLHYVNNSPCIVYYCYCASNSYIQTLIANTFSWTYTRSVFNVADALILCSGLKSGPLSSNLRRTVADMVTMITWACSLHNIHVTLPINKWWQQQPNKAKQCSKEEESWQVNMNANSVWLKIKVYKCFPQRKVPNKFIGAEYIQYDDVSDLCLFIENPYRPPFKDNTSQVVCLGDLLWLWRSFIKSENITLMML